MAQIPSPLANDNTRIAIQYVPTKSLTLAKRQLKKLDDKNIALLGASILQNGLLRPVLVDVKSRIVAGSTVWMTAMQIGMADVPVIQIVLEGLRGYDTIAELAARQAFCRACITLGPRNSWKLAK